MCDTDAGPAELDPQLTLTLFAALLKTKSENIFEVDMMSWPAIPARGRQRQENHHEFEARL